MPEVWSLVGYLIETNKMRQNSYPKDEQGRLHGLCRTFYPMHQIWDERKYIHGVELPFRKSFREIGNSTLFWCIFAEIQEGEQIEIKC